MKTISLVCTVHEENGFASAAALCSILEHLRPEVIFFEAPADAFDELIITGPCLESTAVRWYREANRVAVVPVDLPTPEPRFFERQRAFDQRIAGRISDFQMLMLWNKNDTRDSGFQYLNSDQSSKRWADIYSEIRATVKILNDQEVTDFFELWQRTNDLRENEMLRNISMYCEKHSFERAVFLVGAAHRKSIIEKSQACAVDPGIHWKFSFYVN